MEDNKETNHTPVALPKNIFPDQAHTLIASGIFQLPNSTTVIQLRDIAHVNLISGSKVVVLFRDGNSVTLPFDDKKSAESEWRRITFEWTRTMAYNYCK